MLPTAPGVATQIKQSKGSVYTLFSYIYTPDFLYIHLPDLVSACRWRNENQNIANAHVNTTNIFASYHSYIINATSMELKPPPEGLQAGTLEELIIKVQEHAGRRATLLSRSAPKKSYLQILSTRPGCAVIAGVNLRKEEALESVYTQAHGLLNTHSSVL